MDQFDHRPSPTRSGARPLRYCDVGDVVTTARRRALVVLGPLDQDSRTGAAAGTSIHVYAHEIGLTTRDADEPVVPADTSPRDGELRRAALLRQALAALSYHHEQTLTDHRHSSTTHRDHLTRIRRSLIDEHRAGHLTADALADVLATAGLTPYRPRLRVRFTVSGSYDVPGTLEDIPEVRRRAGDLLLDFTDVDDHVCTTPDLTVQIDDVRPPEH